MSGEPIKERILELRKISKRFPGVQALDAVDLDLVRGEVHALVGENGAGKSTLIKILAGIYQKDSGEIIFEGQPTEIPNPHRAITLGIATVHQDPEMAPELSIAENIFMGALPVKKGGFVHWEKLYADSQRFLGELGMKRSAKEIVRGFGVAERQFIQIARAVALASKMVVLDEPSSALTPRELSTLTEAIRNLKGRGITIVYISHRIDEVFSLADRVTVLKDGRLVKTLHTRDTNKQDLIQLMVGRKLEDQYRKEKTAAGNEEVLKVSGLSRRGVLSGISFSVRRGEVVGIAGLVGSGRTELARAIFGVDRYDEGEIILHGERVHFQTPLQAIRKKVAMLPESRMDGIVPMLSVLENLVLASHEKFSRRGLLQKRACFETSRQMVQNLNIKVTSLKQPAETLSGGNQQKVVFGKWLLTDADLIIFDEPTRGIDVGAKQEIYGIIRAVIRDGKSVLMISSELPEILGMSDRILVMSRGRIVGELPREEATEEKIMRLCIGGV